MSHVKFQVSMYIYRNTEVAILRSISKYRTCFAVHVLASPCLFYEYTPEYTADTEPKLPCMSQMSNSYLPVSITWYQVPLFCLLVPKRSGPFVCSHFVQSSIVFRVGVVPCFSFDPSRFFFLLNMRISHIMRVVRNSQK